MISICVPNEVLPVIPMRCGHCGGNGKVGVRTKGSKDYEVVPCPECNEREDKDKLSPEEFKKAVE